VARLRSTGEGVRSQGDTADDSDVSDPENLDTDEEGLSDTEREYRRSRKLKKQERHANLLGRY
jgi:hypothetical protein